MSRKAKATPDQITYQPATTTLETTVADPGGGPGIVLRTVLTDEFLLHDATRCAAWVLKTGAESVLRYQRTAAEEAAGPAAGPPPGP